MNLFLQEKFRLNFESENCEYVGTDEDDEERFDRLNNYNFKLLNNISSIKRVQYDKYEDLFMPIDLDHSDYEPEELVIHL